MIGMEYLEPKTRRRPGRPLSFDRGTALHKAMLLFWRHGYEATSLNELTAAMGITSPSLYTAFGSKKMLFREAVELYRSGPVTPESIICGSPSAQDAASRLLLSAASGFTGDVTPAGCLLASAAISCSPEAVDVQAELASIRRGIGGLLMDRIVQDITAGRLPAKTDATVLAAHVMAVIQGMSTLARDGATRATLTGIAAVAMAAWPGPTSLSFARKSQKRLGAH